MNRFIIKLKKNILKKQTNKRLLLLVVVFMLLVSLLGLQFIISPETSAYLVSVKGKEIGYIDSEDQLLKIIDSVEKDLSLKYGAEAIIDQNYIKCELIKGADNESMDEKSIYNALAQSENAYLKAWAIMVNDKKVVALNNEDTAKQLLEAVKDQYLKEGSQYLYVGLKENVEVRTINASSDELMDYSSALRYILTGTHEQQEYTVKTGESFWTIAQKFNLSVEELTQANPQIKPEAIQIGQTINLVIAKPFLTVVSIEKAVVSEKVPYDLVYEKTDTLFEGEEKVKIPGVFGVKETQTKVTRENGKEIQIEKLEAEVKEEPKKQTVLIGTKAIPSSLGTGALDNPTRGTVTSPFGRRWGRMHSGVDIANTRGTAIVAADGGIVNFAGWKGDYGLAVIISHGENRTTLYGHCEELLVKKGDKVDKGQIIAKMGNTGRVTGVHLHFEVRVNNVPQNPNKYIDY